MTSEKNDSFETSYRNKISRRYPQFAVQPPLTLSLKRFNATRLTVAGHRNNQGVPVLEGCVVYGKHQNYNDNE